MKLKKNLVTLVRQALGHLYPEAQVSVEMEVPANPQFGDLSTNVALTLSKQLKKNPREVATALVSYIQNQKNSALQEVSLAGPGFINFKFKPSALVSLLEDIQKEGDRFGVSKEFEGKKALVEFVSANPTGPLHIGHGRGAVVGDTLSNLLSAVGYEVTREYYINDGGIQMSTLGKSVYLRYLEKQGQKIDFPETCYQGAYIGELANELLARKKEFEGWSEEKIIEFFGQYAGDKILEEIKLDLKNTGVVFDTYYGESNLYKNGKVDKTLSELKEKGLSYEKDGALWLKSTLFGDDKDRVLIKNDGQKTYLTPDIAYHREKFERGYHLLVNIWGADHAGYGPRLRAAMQGLGYSDDSLKILFIQMVSLIRNGEMVSMSTRRAQYETLENVVKEVGKDVARYFFMSRSYQSQLDFDLELAKKQSAENPAYYIQYAHARICSIFEKAAIETGFDGKWPSFQESFQELLTLPEESALCQKLLEYPEIVFNSVRELSPHRIAHYVLSLAQLFQSYYDKARNDARYKVVSQDPLNTKAKLFLLGAIRQILRNGLGVLGISAPQKM